MLTKCGCKRAEEKKQLVLIIHVYCFIEVVWLIAGMAFDTLDLSKSRRSEGTEPEEYISGLGLGFVEENVPHCQRPWQSPLLLHHLLWV